MTDHVSPGRAKASSKHEAATVPPPPEHCDVLISSANNQDDISLVTLIKGQFIFAVLIANELAK